MANVLHDKGRNHFLYGSINWVTDNIKFQFVSIVNQPTAYVFNASLDEFFASVPTGSRVNTSASLNSKTATSGIADAADQISSGVSGPTIGAIVLYKVTGTAAATDQPLIAYIDTATGMPVGPNGGDITVQWDNGTNKIFKL